MALCLLVTGCSHARLNPYEAAAERANFKRVILPFPPGTRFNISQGAFGAASHQDPGREYSWDFDVPFGTPVISIEDGKVLQVWKPASEGGCDPRFSELAHNVKILHRDGTVAQYVHVDARVAQGNSVRQGQVIAVTAKNGFTCTPQLDFGVFQDRAHLPGSGQMRNIPLFFDGLPEGLAREGYEGLVDRIRTWHQGFYDQHPYQPFPKRIEFENKGTRLMYVATKHKKTVESRRAIELAFKAFHPDAVLIEGIHIDWGTSPRNWDKDLEARIDQEGYECYYAYKKAVESNTPFVGSEPPGMMSDYSGLERDRAVVARLRGLVAKNKRIMIVYGAGHFVQEELELEDMFGPPRSIR